MRLVYDGLLLLRLAYYRWALRSMGPAHEDFTPVFQHVGALADRLNTRRGTK